MATQSRAPTSDFATGGTVAYSSGTTGYNLVNDYPDTADPLTSYVTLGTTANSFIVYNFTAFTIPDGATAISVAVEYTDEEPSNGANTSDGRLRVNGTYYDSGTTHNPATSTTSRSKTFANNPNTAAAWTVEDINGTSASPLQGFGVIGPDSNPVHRHGSIQCTVTYTPQAALSETPGLAELALTGYAPTVFIPAMVDPGVAVLTITGYAPVLTSPPAGGFPAWPALWPYGFGKAAGGFTANPGVASLSLTGYEPTPTATDHKSVATGLGELALTGYSPAATIQFAISAGLASLTLDGYAPTFLATDHKTVSAGLGELTLTGLEPIPTATAHQFAAPDLASLSLTGYEPTVTAGDNKAVSPGLAELVLGGLEPTSLATDHKTVFPDFGTLTLTGYAPQVGDNPNIESGVASLVLTGYEPSLSGSAKGFQSWVALWPYGFGRAEGFVYPGVGSLVLTGYAPTVVTPISLEAGLASLTITGYAPSTSPSHSINPGLAELVITGYVPGQTLTLPAPGNASLVLTGYAPTASVSASQSISAGLASLTLTGYEPTAIVPVLVSVDVASLTLDGYAPSVSVTVSASPGLAELTLTGYEPTVVIPAVAEPGLAELSISGHSPAISATDHKWADAALAELLIGCFEPSVDIATGATISTGLAELSLEGHTPAISATDHQWADAALAQLVIECFAPGTSIFTGPELTTGLGELFITGYAPDSLGGEAMVIPGRGGAAGGRRQRYVVHIDGRRFIGYEEEIRHILEQLAEADAQTIIEGKKKPKRRIVIERGKAKPVQPEMPQVAVPEWRVIQDDFRRLYLAQLAHELLELDEEETILLL